MSIRSNRHDSALSVVVLQRNEVHPQIHVRESQAHQLRHTSARSIHELQQRLVPDALGRIIRKGQHLIHLFHRQKLNLTLIVFRRFDFLKRIGFPFPFIDFVIVECPQRRNFSVNRRLGLTFIIQFQYVSGCITFLAVVQTLSAAALQEDLEGFQIPAIGNESVFRLVFRIL